MDTAEPLARVGDALARAVIRPKRRKATPVLPYDDHEDDFQKFLSHSAARRPQSPDSIQGDFEDRLALSQECRWNPLPTLDEEGTADTPLPIRHSTGPGSCSGSSSTASFQPHHASGLSSTLLGSQDGTSTPAFPSGSSTLFSIN